MEAPNKPSSPVKVPGRILNTSSSIVSFEPPLAGGVGAGGDAGGDAGGVDGGVGAGIIDVVIAMVGGAVVVAVARTGVASASRATEPSLVEGGEALRISSSYAGGEVVEGESAAESAPSDTRRLLESTEAVVGLETSSFCPHILRRVSARHTDRAPTNKADVQSNRQTYSRAWIPGSWTTRHQDTLGASP